MTVDDHTAAQAARAITSGIYDLHEMVAEGKIVPVHDELDELTRALINLGNLIAFLNLREVA